MLDDVFYALYNVVFTVEAVAMTMLCEQDVSFKHSSQTEFNKPGLYTYAIETKGLGFSIATYYKFCRTLNMKSLL